MLALPPILVYALGFVAHFKYLLLFVGAVIEGPILTVVTGFLLHQGAFNFAFAYSALALGDLAADIAWYYIGYFFAEPVLRRHGKFFGLTPELFEKIKSIFHRRHSIILFLSKITMGFGMALGTLMAAGAARIPLRLFLFYNTLGELVYVAILMSLGYYLGYLYGAIETGFRLIGLFGAIAVIGLAFYGFTRFIKNKTAAL